MLWQFDLRDSTGLRHQEPTGFCRGDYENTDRRVRSAGLRRLYGSKSSASTEEGALSPFKDSPRYCVTDQMGPLTASASRTLVAFRALQSVLRELMADAC